jgi:hypothetical protein
VNANLVFGYALLLIGTFAMAGGVAVAMIDALRPPKAPEGLVDDIKSIAEAIAKVLAELAKFKPGMQLMLLGAIIFVGGGYLVSAQPF